MAALAGLVLLPQDPVTSLASATFAICLATLVGVSSVNLQMHTRGGETYYEQPTSHASLKIPDLDSPLLIVIRILSIEALGLRVADKTNK